MSHCSNSDKVVQLYDQKVARLFLSTLCAYITYYLRVNMWRLAMWGNVFQDRSDAGRILGEELARLVQSDEALIVAIPKGGVVVGAEVARRVKAPMETVIVRKIESPLQPDTTVGVVAEGGVEIIEPDAARMLGLKDAGVRSLMDAQRAPLGRRVKRYGLWTSDLRDRTVVLIDEGITSGLTMSAAISAVRRRNAGRVLVAVPVASVRGLKMIRQLVDRVICLQEPQAFSSVGQWYREFEPLTDTEALSALSSVGWPPPVLRHVVN
jgi:putative phosphoribosyl transferase